VQVDRAVEPSSTLLAGHMKVTPQHALGSLVGFWKLCGDPRELERIVETTPAGVEPAVILTGEDVALRFELASDHRVEPLILARLGILEPSGERFRVRGMSRFFEPIEARIRARAVAAKGGRASAASRLAATGSSQPKQGSGQPTPEAAPEPARTDSRTGAEPTFEPTPEPARTLAVSGQRSQTEKNPTAPAEAVADPSFPQLELVSPPTPIRRQARPPDPAAEFSRFTSTLTDDEAGVFAAYESAMGLEVGPDWSLKKLIGQKLKAHTADELCAAIKGHASDSWRREKSPSLRAILRDASVIAAMAKLGRSA
jgi:hypothetical protein